MNKSKNHNGHFKSGDEHPRATNLQAIEKAARSLPLGSLSIVNGSIYRDGKHRKVKAACSICEITYVLYVDNILSGKTKGCLCQQRIGKYRDPRAKILGQRYDSMVQRCTRETHVSWKNYMGRGIQVRFSRSEFIKWGLSTFPKTDFKGLDFDRIDNNGHYEIGNLRLVSRPINLRNTRRSRTAIQ